MCVSVYKGCERDTEIPQFAINDLYISIKKCQRVLSFNELLSYLLCWSK